MKSFHLSSFDMPGKLFCSLRNQLLCSILFIGSMLIPNILSAQCTGVGSTSSVTITRSIGCANGTGSNAQWDGPSGGSISDPGGSSSTFDVTWTSTGTFRLKRTFPSGCISTVVYSSYYTVGSIPGTPTTSPVSRCGTGTVTLTASPGSNGSGVKWTNAGGATLSTSNSFTSPSISATTTYYVATTASSGCESSRIPVNAIVDQSPTASSAGPDQTGSTTCGASVSLAANTPSVGTGNWSVFSGAGGSFGNASSATSTFSGTSGTSYTLRWTITNGSCGSSTDDVIVTFNRLPTTSNAGPDQTAASTCGLTTVNLAGNTPSFGTGSWSIVSGAGGTLGNAASATSTFIGTAGTTYTLRWTISNSPCTASTDDVIITFNRAPTVSNAGPDQTSASTCGLTSVTLAGNTPSIGTGNWSIVSGTGGTLGNAASATSTFSGTAGTSYTLRWTISNSPCTASTDDVIVTFNRLPTTSNAGPDQTAASTCGLTTVTLAGNTPSVGTGIWSIVSGAGGTLGNAASATSTFSGTAGTTYTLRRTISNSPCTASTDDVIITFNRLPTTSNAGPDQTAASTCGLTSVTLAGNTPTIGLGTWSVISGSGGNVVNSTLPTSTFSGTAGTTYTLRWTISNSPCTASSDNVIITFNRAPTVSNAGSDQNGSSTCGLTSVTLAGNTPSVGTGSWSIVSGSGGTLSNAASATSTFSGTSGTTYTLRWTISNSPCTASTDDVIITFNRVPTVSNAGPDQNGSSTCGLTTVTLAGNTPTIGTGIWSIISGSGGTLGNAASAASTFSGIAGATYTLRRTVSNSPCAASTDDMIVKFNNDLQLCVNQNYIVTNTLEVNGILTESAIAGLAEDKNDKVIQYFDGLGRLMQTVNKQASPNNHWDLIQPVVYDNNGREFRKYLPFAAGADGWYKSGVIDVNGDYAGVALNFYNNSTDKIADDNKPFAETKFELSPLNRVLEQGSSGLDWQPDATDSYTSTDKTIKKSYQLNNVSEVLKWTFTYPTVTYPFGIVNAGTAAVPVYYTVGQLSVNKTKDEQNNEVIEYVDNEGHTVLKRVQVVSGTPAINDSNYASTYYIYNGFGSLVCVIPPEATQQLATGYYQSGATDITKDEFLKRWAFRYAYDARKRMSMKQVPGADPVYMVYDNHDRLVLTQDGNQRTGATSAIKYWTFTRYDELNRPILTGIKDTTTTIQLTQAQMQGVVDLYYSEIPTKPWRKYGEKFVGTAAANNVHGYTNYSYPRVTSAATLNVNNYLTVTYYDNYTFRNDWLGSYAYLSDALTNTSLTGTYTQVATGLENQRVIGQVTGSKIKVLDGGITGGSTWLKSINYYDDKYRTIQTKADNHKGGIDRASNLYDFTGKILKTKFTHEESDVTWKDIVGASVTGIKITRTAAGSSWGASGAASLQQLPAGQNGWMEVIASETNLYRMAGLSDTNPDPNYTTIDYAWFLRNDGLLEIYESGTLRGAFGPYVSGDVLRIERTGTSVKYYQNGILKYPSTIASNTLLMVDVALYDLNSTVAGVRTSFSATSKFIQRTFEYDHAGRLTKIWHQIDTQPQILLSKNEYNELGQLVDKKLHSTVTDAVDAKQSVDYRYNIRGWLTSMNDAALTLDGAEPKDYFGMNLVYNNTDLGIGNTGLFNGNISGMTWSSNQGLGTTKQNAYTYKYDAMNRIAGSFFKEKTTTWNDPANNGFDERGFTYDLNGNITKLTRFDKKVAGFMDSLTYNYGSGTTLSNRLLKVEDGGNDFAGFIDGNADASEDYTYDANGNLTRDRNKGIGTSLTDPTNIITYNYLNLPETITKGGNNIRYIYDATGRKLSQVVTTGTTQKQTDYVGEFTYENDALQYISHEEGRVMMSSTKLIYADHGESTAKITARLSATLATLTQNGTEKYVQVTSGTAVGSGAFPIGGTFPVVAYERYRIRVKGYRSTMGATGPFILIKASGVNLNWPGAKVPYGVQSESWVEQIITIPAGATTLEAGVVWNSNVGGEVFYLNEFEITKLETTTPEYQYNLKDHLGNVRLTFTTKQETDAATATLETANEAAEQSKFLRYGNARKVNYYLFDHTNGSSPTTTTGVAQRLSGQTNEVYGLARSLSVMPGDVINMEVYGKYIDSNTANLTTALNTLVSQIASGTAPGGTVIDGGTYGSSTTSFPFPAGLNGTTSSSGTGPKAYLNWLVYDRNDNLILSKCGYHRLTTAAREYGQDAAHEKLSGTVSIAEAGYVYIYLSNEEGASAYEVYFDEFKVDHIKSPVIQTDDYYPFGLTYNSYSRENSVPNDIKFQGQEHVDDLGLNWDSFKWRNHQPEIGRFFNIDPLSEKYYYNSPYAFSENKVTSHVELEGLESVRIDEVINAIISPGSLIVNGNRNDAGAVSRATGLPGARDGHQDAFRHTIWNAMNSRDIGSDDAEPFATLHETGSNANDPSSNLYDPIAVQMDLFNNEKGRLIGEANPDATDTELAALVNQAMANGELKMIVKMDFNITIGVDAKGNAIKQVFNLAVDSSNNPISDAPGLTAVLTANGLAVSDNSQKQMVKSTHPTVQPNGTTIATPSQGGY